MYLLAKNKFKKKLFMVTTNDKKRMRKTGKSKDSHAPDCIRQWLSEVDRNFLYMPMLSSCWLDIRAKGSQ